jgi:hypothetical protein
MPALRGSMPRKDRAKGMRVRRLITDVKTQRSDTGWADSDLPPRHCPIYARTRPIRAGWKWRSAACDVADTRHFLVALCNARRDNWQAFLMIETDCGISIIARFEHHGSHPGLHGHAHCERGGVETGPSGLDGLVRIPPSGAIHRRTNAWTEQTFWEAARQFFRVTDNVTGQRQLTLI